MRDFVVFPDEIQQAASRLRERLEYAYHDDMVDIIVSMWQITQAGHQEIDDAGKWLYEMVVAHDEYQAEMSTTRTTRSATSASPTPGPPPRISATVAARAAARMNRGPRARTTVRAHTRAVARAIAGSTSNALSGAAFNRFLQHLIRPKSFALRQMSVEMAQAINRSLGDYDELD
ncbi:MAG: hypothetical protein LQ349_000320 [Xanthoria aureola]|nr:MAG: hypothetical protein LQ349_000320 [Xanthoria aureola]